MKCPICRYGETRPGAVTVPLERGGMTIVFRCGVNGTAVANASPDGLGFGRLPSVLGW